MGNVRDPNKGGMEVPMILLGSQQGHSSVDTVDITTEERRALVR